MPAFLGAAGHAEGLMHVVTRHDPLEKKRFRCGQNGSKKAGKTFTLRVVNLLRSRC